MQPDGDGFGAGVVFVDGAVAVELEEFDAELVGVGVEPGLDVGGVGVGVVGVTLGVTQVGGTATVSVMVVVVGR